MIAALNVWFRQKPQFRLRGGLGLNNDIQLTLLPFVKPPTAQQGIGIGEWDGGLIVPAQMPLATLSSGWR